MIGVMGGEGVCPPLSPQMNTKPHIIWEHIKNSFLSLALIWNSFYVFRWVRGCSHLYKWEMKWRLVFLSVKYILYCLLMKAFFSLKCLLKSGTKLKGIYVLWVYFANYFKRLKVSLVSKRFCDQLFEKYKAFSANVLMIGCFWGDFARLLGLLGRRPVAQKVVQNLSHTLAEGIRFLWLLWVIYSGLHNSRVSVRVGHGFC